MLPKTRSPNLTNLIKVRQEEKKTQSKFEEYHNIGLPEPLCTHISKNLVKIKALIISSLDYDYL